jgi:hypothetical protein
MNRVSPAQLVLLDELAGSPLDVRVELDRTYGIPVARPRPTRSPEIALVEVMVPAQGSERRAHLRVGDAAGECAVAAIPQGRRDVTAALLDHELHERARVEVHERHR